MNAEAIDVEFTTVSKEEIKAPKQNFVRRGWEWIKTQGNKIHGYTIGKFSLENQYRMKMLASNFVGLFLTIGISTICNNLLETGGLFFPVEITLIAIGAIAAIGTFYFLFRTFVDLFSSVKL
jgi:hypothetical protein